MHDPFVNYVFAGIRNTLKRFTDFKTLIYFNKYFFLIHLFILHQCSNEYEWLSLEQLLFTWKLFLLLSCDVTKEVVFSHTERDKQNYEFYPKMKHRDYIICGRPITSAAREDGRNSPP